MVNSKNVKLENIQPLACHIAAQLPTCRDEAEEVVKKINEILDLFAIESEPDPTKRSLRLVKVEFPKASPD